jgi:hypothetical protein
MGIAVAMEASVMVTLDDRVRLARACLDFAARMRLSPHPGRERTMP